MPKQAEKSASIDKAKPSNGATSTGAAATSTPASAAAGATKHQTPKESTSSSSTDHKTSAPEAAVAAVNTPQQPVVDNGLHKMSYATVVAQNPAAAAKAASESDSGASSTSDTAKAHNQANGGVERSASPAPHTTITTRTTDSPRNSSHHNVAPSRNAAGRNNHATAGRGGSRYNRDNHRDSYSHNHRDSYRDNHRDNQRDHQRDHQRGNNGHYRGSRHNGYLPNSKK